MKLFSCICSRDIDVKKKCHEFKIGMDNAKLRLTYYDITAKEFVNSIDEFLDYCESPSYICENNVRCIPNTYKLRKTKHFQGLGLNSDVEMVCVWNNHIMFVKDDLIAPHWEYIVREIGGYPYPPHLTLQKTKRPEDIPDYTWEYRLFGDHNVKFLIINN